MEWVQAGLGVEFLHEENGGSIEVHAELGYIANRGGRVSVPSMFSRAPLWGALSTTSEHTLDIMRPHSLSLSGRI